MIIHKCLHLLKQETPLHITSFNVRFDGAFPENIRIKIYNSIKNIIENHGSFIPSTARLAKEIQEKEALKSVHTFVAIDGSLSIHLAPRTPVMYVMADREFLVSKDGEIYEDHNFMPPEPVFLKGAFANHHAPLQLNDKNSLLTSESEKKIILNAITLLERAKSHSIFLAKIEYKSYRGFYATLRGANTTVVFGNPPFDKQLIRLTRILDEASRRSAFLTNIEVDYNDKAFITELRH